MKEEFKIAKQQPKILTEVQSIHEQREIFGNPDIIVKPGVWIEVLNFDPQTEQVEHVHRWEVEKVEKKQGKGKEKDIKKYKIICKPLDIKKDWDKKLKLSERLLKKHEEKFKASFAKCLVEGINVKSIPKLKYILNKLGGNEEYGNKQKDSK